MVLSYEFRIETGRKLIATAGAEFSINFSMETTAKGETKHECFKFLKRLYEILPETAEDWN